MTRPMVITVFVAAMIALIVGVDLLFFSHRFWPRLIANVGIVLVAGVFYFTLLKNL